MTYTLPGLGWSPFFAGQTGAGPASEPFRICAVHRGRLSALGQSGETSLTTPGDMSTGDFTVGDWVLADNAGEVLQRLDRQTLIQRRAAGADVRTQLVAANVDVLFIVSSCNADFNIARLERYLALAYDSGCFPVIALTKADTCDDPDGYARQAEKIAPAVPVLCIDAKDEAGVQQVAQWCRPGQTAAFLGSSGVGKTTLTNGLTGQQAATGAIREDDAKGRHVTTSRVLLPMRNGGWVIDTPGMRSLSLFDSGDGIERLFHDIAELALTCRFSDCNHTVEPGCAVQTAVTSGQIDPARLARWNKLRAEDLHNTQTLAQSRARGRTFAKMVNNAQRSAKTRKGR